MGTYAGRYDRPLGLNHKAFGGAAEGLGLNAIAGETDLITVFDDFDTTATGEAFGAATGLETMGWGLLDVGIPVGDVISINPQSPTPWRPSCLRAFAGTANDTGGLAVLNNAAAGGARFFPSIHIPATTSDPSIDNTTWVFATRIGLERVAGTGWPGKFFIGFFINIVPAIMAPATGVLNTGANKELVGFHVAEDGHIDLVTNRDNTAVQFIELQDTSWVADIVTGTPVWFDLAFRMDYRDWSSATDNGTLRGYIRRLPVPTGRISGTRTLAPQDQLTTFREVGTISNWNLRPVSVQAVPGFEVINSTTGDCAVNIDWWAMGCSRFSRMGTAGS